MSINTILQYRTPIMGFAALWIFFCHSYYSGCYNFLAPFKPVIAFGWAGVDIFLLLSGLGIGLSLQKKPSFITFFKRRLDRIYISYIICISLLHILVYKFNFFNFLLDVSTLGYWIPYQNNFFTSFWYINAILVLYIISYPLFCIIKKYPIIFFIIFSTTSLILYFSTNYAEFFFARIPIYFLGLLLSLYRYYNFPKKVIILIILFSLATFIFLCFLTTQIGGKYVSDLKLKIPLFFFITPGIIILLTKFFDTFKQKYITKIFFYFGSISLEFYLVHWGILMLLKELTIELNWLFYLLSSIIISIILKRTTNTVKLIIQKVL